jgi:hypothetical protein
MDVEFRYIQMELTMMVIGLMDCNMGLEKKRIQSTNISTKDSGSTDKKMEKARSSGKMDLGMTVTGKMEINMDMESFTDVMIEFTSDNGKTINCMDMVNSHGLTVRNIRAITQKI